VNEVQPIGDELWEDVGIHHDDDADDGCERHGVPEDEAEDGAFVADLLVAAVAMQMDCASIILPITPPALLVAHMRMGLRLSCWAVIFCKPPKRTFEDVSLPVRAISEPADEGAEERKEPARTRECET